MDEFFKRFAKAIDDVVQIGGRLSQESYEFIRDILDDNFDSFKKQVTEIVKGVLSDLTERVEELEDLLKEKEKQIKAESDDKSTAKKAVAAKKAST